MPISYVRDTGHVTGNGVNSIAANFLSLPAAGNSIIVTVSCYNAVGTVSITVNNNQTDNIAQDVFMDPVSDLEDSECGIFADIDIGTPSGGTYTITVDPSGTTDYFEWTGTEFSGLEDSAALDITTSSNGIDTSPTVTGSTTGQADELWIGVMGAAGTTGQTAIGIDLPATWNQIGNIIQDAYSTVAYMAAYKIVSSTGALSFNGGTLSDTPLYGWTIAAAAYKAKAAVLPGEYRVGHRVF